MTHIPTMEPIVDVNEAKSHFEANCYDESLVLSLDLSIAKQVILVVDYAELAVSHAIQGTRPIPRPPRDFRMLSFLHVDDLRIKKGTAKLEFLVEDKFIARNGIAPVTLNSAYFSTINSDKMKAEFLFGHHGRLDFTFSGFDFKQRLADAREHNGDWIYKDVQNGEEFNFYLPFPEVVHGQRDR